MQILLITIGSVFAIFLCFCIGMMIGLLFGRYRQRRCACAESKRVLKIIEERKRSAAYTPEKVDPHNLPIVDPDRP